MRNSPPWAAPAGTYLGLYRAAAADARPYERPAAELGIKMPNYLHQAGGTLEGGFPWSINMVSVATATETTAETTWADGIVNMFSLAGFRALVPAGTILTFTSTSTANAVFKQTTKTTTTHSIAGTGGAGLPYQVGEVVTWRTTQATKWGRGRWYLPPMTAAALDTAGFILAAASVTEVVDAVNLFLTAIIGTLSPQILHRKNTLSGPLANTLTPIVTGDVSDKCVIQRRRGDKFVPTRTALTF